jgi:UDP-N-acetylenolpyruvoylglucosamine reductase
MQAELILDKQKRQDCYPKDPSCGCFFKNIELDKITREKIEKALGKEYIMDRRVGDNFSVGLLLDKLGLKGLSVGGAMVSREHANFIINQGTATSQDVYDLYKKIKAEVKERVGIDLENEVQFCGEFAD